MFVSTSIVSTATMSRQQLQAEKSSNPMSVQVRAKEESVAELNKQISRCFSENLRKNTPAVLSKLLLHINKKQPVNESAGNVKASNLIKSEQANGSDRLSQTATTVEYISKKRFVRSYGHFLMGGVAVYNLNINLGQGGSKVARLAAAIDQPQLYAYVKPYSSFKYCRAFANLKRDELESERFSNEIALLKSFTNQHVPRIVCEFRGPKKNGISSLKVLMEFGNYGDLAEHINSRSALLQEETNIILILRGCLVALVESAAKGFIHRDIKPDNILLHMDPQKGLVAKIIDWGFACKVTDRKSILTSCGSPGYVDPEAMRGDISLYKPKVEVLQDKRDAAKFYQIKSIISQSRCHSMTITKGETVAAECLNINVAVYREELAKQRQAKAKKEYYIGLMANTKRDIWSLGLIAYELVHGRFFPVIASIEYDTLDKTAYFKKLIGLQQETINMEFDDSNFVLDELIINMLQLDQEKRWSAARCLEFLDNHFPSQKVKTAI